jgi:uncharacterized protein
MFLNVSVMELRKIRFDQTYPPGEIQFLEEKIWQAGPLRAVGSAELLPNTGGEIRIRGRLSVRMESECDRCLEVAGYPLEVDFDLFYRPAAASPEGSEVALKPGESEVDFYEGEGLELKVVLREQILLSLPMQRTCSENCKGICPACGMNRNRAECGCLAKAPDDRWAALRNL